MTEKALGDIAELETKHSYDRRSQGRDCQKIEGLAEQHVPWMKPNSRGQVQLAVRMMDLMQAPQPGEGMAKIVTGVLDEIQHQKREHDSQAQGNRRSVQEAVWLVAYRYRHCDRASAKDQSCRNGGREPQKTVQQPTP
jgi:hypothetical protein